MCPASSFRCGRPLLTLAVVWASAARAAAAEPCEVRLGGAIASTGSYTVYGTEVVQGFTLWAETLNAQGGLRLPGGNCTIHLPLLVRDDKSSKTESPRILQDMLNASSPGFADLHFVIGPASSGITGVNAPVAQQAGKILFSTGASESLYDKGNEYIFSVLTPGRQYMASALRMLHRAGARSVVFAHESKSFSQSVCQGANATAVELGMEVPGYYEYEAGKSNFADLVYEIKRLRADVYVGCGHLDDVTHVVGNANVLNVNPRAMLVTHASDYRIIQNVGVPYSHGLLSPTQWDESLQFRDDDGFFGTAADFGARYAERFSQAPSYQAAYSAAHGYVLGKAIEAAGSLETEPVRAALQRLKLNSFYGNIEFSRPGDPSGLVGTMPRRPMVTTQIHNGSALVVAPEEAASAGLIYPLPTWSEKALLLYPCLPGAYEDGVSSDGAVVCRPCAAGQFRDTSMMACSPCGPGEFAGSPGQPRCLRCPAATYSEGASGSVSCLGCPSGAYCAEGASTPSPCPLGSYCPAGQALPLPCPAGTQRSEEGASELSACEVCAPGRHSGSAGTSECQACAPGWHTPRSGQRECSRCPFGTYRREEGGVNCTACPATYVTRLTGADSADACTCDEGMYLDRSAGVCARCPEGAVCVGGVDVPMIGEGFYGELQGDPALPLGSPGAFSGLLVWTCPQPGSRYCPGRDLPAPDAGLGNASGLAPADAGVVAAVRLAGECPSHHMGISCGRCEDGYWNDGGECVKCGTSNIGVLVGVGMAVGSFLSFVIYRFAGKEVPEQFTAPVLLTCTIGLALRFAQFLAVLGSFNPELPAQAQETTRSMSFALGDPPAMNADCFAGTSFQVQYTSQAVRPLIIAFFFFGNWALSVFLNAATRGYVKRMSFDHTCNVCGMVLVSLYVGLCKVSISFFECTGHAAAPDTLLQFPSVVCNSDEHMSMAALGYLAVAVYMIGILALAVYVSIRAPALYRESPSFRVRFRFLFSRWRPDKWYFGAVYMLRDALVLLVAVMAPKDTVVQLSLMLIFLALPMVSVALHWPWRDNRTNYVDMAITVGLITFIALSYKFVTNTEDATGKGMAEAIGFFMVLLLGCVGTTIFATVCYCVFLIKNRSKVEAARSRALDELSANYISLGGVLANQDASELTQILEPCSAVDLQDLSRVFRLIQAHCVELQEASRAATVNFSLGALRSMSWKQGDQGDGDASGGVLSPSQKPAGFSSIWDLGASPTKAGRKTGLYEAAASGVVLSPRTPPSARGSRRDKKKASELQDDRFAQGADAPTTLLRTLREDGQPPSRGAPSATTVWV